MDKGREGCEAAPEGHSAAAAESAAPAEPGAMVVPGLLAVHSVPKMTTEQNLKGPWCWRGRHVEASCHTGQTVDSYQNEQPVRQADEANLKSYSKQINYNWK